MEVLDLEVRRRYCDALYEKIQWKPDEPEFHLFSIDLDSVAAVQIEDGEMTHRVWPGAEGVAAD